MTPELCVRHSSGHLSPMRRARWFRWVLFAAVLCTVGLYTLEFAHHHETAAAELHCPICQVMTHSALDIFSPQFKPLPPAIRFHFLAFTPRLTSVQGRVLTVKYQSRAPPVF
ncbi:MAG: hypothetical protein ACRESE_07595 [Gammaproteobacteria bacterium]